MGISRTCAILFSGAATGILVETLYLSNLQLGWRMTCWVVLGFRLSAHVRADATALPRKNDPEGIGNDIVPLVQTEERFY